MKHRPKTTAQIVYDMANASSKKYTAVGAKVGLLLTILILNDMWDFSKEDIHTFLAQYEQLFVSYSNGEEDVTEWLKNVKDELDIDIAEFIRRIV